MGQLTRGAKKEGHLCIVGNVNTSADDRSAPSPDVCASAGIGANAALFSREWPAETTSPTVELPAAELPDAVTKSRVPAWQSRHVAWDEIGVALFAIAMLLLVSVVGVGR